MEIDISYLRKFPFDSIYYEITSYCNAQCSYCYNSSSGHGKYVPFFHIKDVMKQIFQMNPQTSVVLSGGEPLFHPNIREIVELVCQNHSEVTVITNAFLIDKMDSRTLLENCNIQVTIESMREELHDSIRGQGSFQNITRLQEYVPNIKHTKRILRVNLTRYNIRYIEDFMRFAVESGYTHISFGLLAIQGRALRDENAIDFEEDREICNNAIKLIKENAYRAQKNIVVEWKNCLPRTGCQLLNKENPGMALRIDAEGYVFPCLYFNDIDHSMGNIQTNCLQDIIKGEQFANLLNRLLYRESHMDSCRQCIWDKYCFKGCPALAFSKRGKLDEKIFCQFLKETFHDAIKLGAASMEGMKREHDIH